MQKAIVVTGYWCSDGKWTDSTEELNKFLAEGWKVVSTSPMGAYGYPAYGSDWFAKDSDHGFATLVIIEKYE